MLNAKVIIKSKLPSIATMIWLAHKIPRLKVSQQKENEIR